MKNNVNEALNNVDATYDDLVKIANDIAADVLGDLDDMIKSAYEDVEKMTNDAIRELILKLSLRSYSFSEIKEKALFKAVMAETLRKEAYATRYNTAEGTAAVRDNIATLDISSEIVADEIYNFVAAIFKTKLDELHRIVAALTTVLTTRLTEAKLTAVGMTND